MIDTPKSESRICVFSLRLCPRRGERRGGWCGRRTFTYFLLTFYLLFTYFLLTFSSFSAFSLCGHWLCERDLGEIGCHQGLQRTYYCLVQRPVERVPSFLYPQRSRPLPNAPSAASSAVPCKHGVEAWQAEAAPSPRSRPPPSHYILGGYKSPVYSPRHPDDHPAAKPKLH